MARNKYQGDWLVDKLIKQRRKKKQRQKKKKNARAGKPVGGWLDSPEMKIVREARKRI